MFKRRSVPCLLTGAAALLLIGRSQADPIWTGAGPDDNWSTGANWSGGVPPAPPDVPIFNAGDSGNPNVVDTNFTISGLQYIGNGTHTTRLSDLVTLQVNGPVTFGLGTTTLVAPTTAAVLFGTPPIRLPTCASPTTTLALARPRPISTSRPPIRPSPRSSRAICRLAARPALRPLAAIAANGSLILGSNSTITLGSTAAPATLNIGWSQNLSSGVRATGSATGVFDALATGAALDLHLSELNVGRGSLRGVRDGNPEVESDGSHRRTGRLLRSRQRHRHP